MDAASRSVLMTSLPELLEQLQLTARLKAAVLAAGLLDDDDMDKVEGRADKKDQVFQFVQRIKKAKNGKFEAFVEALVTSGQAETANNLRLKHAQVSQSSGPGPGRSPGPVPTVQNSCISHKGHERPASFPRPDDCLKSSTMTNPTSLNVNAPWSQAVVPLSQQMSTEDLRAELSHCMEKLDPCSKAQYGDIIVTVSYPSEIRRFAKGKSANRPDELQSPSLTAGGLLSSGIDFMAALCAARVSQLLGGKSQLFYDSRHGCVFVGIYDSQVKFCRIEIFVLPYKAVAVDAWLNADFNLRDTIASTLGWIPSKAVEYDNEKAIDVDLSINVWSWFKPSKTAKIYVESDL